MTAREELIHGRALIEDPRKWVKFIRKTVQNGVVAYCALGAQDHVRAGMFTADDSGAVYELAKTMKALAPEIGIAGSASAVAQFNNYKGHAETLRAYDLTIDRLVAAPEREPELVTEPERELVTA